MQNKTDEIIREIADYVLNSKIESDEAFKIAHYNVLDALGCGIFALQFPACTRLLGPIVPNVKIENGAVTELLNLDAKILRVTKAKESEDLIYQYMSFNHYPDVMYSNLSFEATLLALVNSIIFAARELVLKKMMLSQHRLIR